MCSKIRVRVHRRNDPLFCYKILRLNKPPPRDFEQGAAHAHKVGATAAPLLGIYGGEGGVEVAVYSDSGDGAHIDQGRRQTLKTTPSNEGGEQEMRARRNAGRPSGR